MADIFRGQGRGVVGALLGFLFVVLASHQARAQLYEQPVLVIDPGMHTSLVKNGGVDAAGRIAVTGSYDKTLRVWSLPDGSLLRTIRMPAGPGATGQVFAVAVNADGTLVAAGGATNAAPDIPIYVFETLTGKMAARIAGPHENTMSLAFSPDGHYLAAGLGSTFGLRVYDRDQQWSEVFRDDNYSGHIYGLTFSSDGRLATTSFDGNVRLYDRAFRLIVPPKKVTGGSRPFKIAFSPNGALVAVSYDDAQTVDLLDGHSLAPLAGPRRLEQWLLGEWHHFVNGRRDPLRRPGLLGWKRPPCSSLGWCGPWPAPRFAGWIHYPVGPGATAGWSALGGDCYPVSGVAAARRQTPLGAPFTHGRISRSRRPTSGIGRWHGGRFWLRDTWQVAATL
jgi:hypothetical protein